MALQYLLDPAFQVVNTAGKPATGGYINVFIHGTREKYYCASDFNGTLHPFNIPLDSLGSNVVLADDSRAYDVYVYNRYGTQLYSRYNVKASAGGGISSTEITSSDGSITVTDTANGVDLSVNGVKPSVLRAGTIPRTSDGNFTFTYKEREGDDITLDQGGIKLAKGWYHYDVAVEIEWNAPAENRSVPVVITAANGAARDELDLTFSHTDSLTLCGELHNPSVNLMDFEVAASGIPTGATVRVKEVGIHTVHGAGAGGSGEKNIHRLLRWYTETGTADYPAGDWLHDLDAEDPNDPSGHPRVTADQLFEWYEQGQNFELYEVDSSNGQLGWSAVYRMVTWQDQSDWWSQFAPVPGKACRLEFFRMGMYSTPYRGGLIAYIRYKEEEYMRLYEIVSGQSIWMAEYQEKLPYYRYDWHNGDYLRVNEAGSGLEWVPLPPQANADWNAVSGPSEILNKPEIPTKTSDLTNDSGFITSAEIPEQVNADWNATSGPAEILHKPSIPTKTSDLDNDSGFITSSDIPEQVNADWEATSGAAEILNKPETAPLVAGTNITITETQDGIEISAAGSVEQVNADWNATSGPAEILNKPTIPTKTSDLQNDSGFITIADVPEQVKSDWDATSGPAEILNKPTIPTNTSDLNNDSGFITAADIPTQVKSDWDAVSGPAEILNKPAIPTKTSDLNNDSGFITLSDVPAQVNSDWNATSGPEEILNKPAIPTKTSDLQNDSGYITLSDVPAQVNADWNATSGPEEILNKPSIPSKTSDLQNDSGYITLSDVPAQVNSDWNAVSGPSEILNKPGIKPIVAGTNITITETSTGVEISAQGGGTAQVNADWNAVSGPAEILHKPTIPSKTSDLTNDSGFITAAEVPAQVNADWSATSGAAEILNKPDIKPIVAGANITITESSTGVEIAAAAQVNSNWEAVSGPEEILHKPQTAPLVAGTNITITETQNGIEIAAQGGGSSVNADWNAISGPAEILNKPDLTLYATKAELNTKEDEFAAGTGLEFTTDGLGNRVLQVEAPVDIVAGPGIVIDNPDGNTLRVSVAQDIETVLWESNNADGTAPSGFPLTLSETPANFDIVRFYYRPWSTNDCVVDKMGSQTVFMLESSWLNTAQSAAPYSFLDVLTLSGTSLAFTRGCFSQWSQTTVTEDTGYFRIYKIVGIHRIANN